MTTKDYINELDSLTSALKKQPQFVGFNHKFYVPGFIGFIQEWIVESKMNKVARTPIYNGKGYYACADKIMKLVDGACKSKKESAENFEKNNQDPESLQILTSASNALEAWVEIYPEIAYWMNRKINDRYITNAFGVIQGNIRESMSTIMDIPKDNFRPKYKTSFGSQMKSMGNQVLGMICNVILFALIIVLFATIFG